MKKSTSETFGSHLRRAMNAAQLTQETLADAAGVGQSTVSRLMNDAYKPKPEQVISLADACGVHRQALVGGTEHAGMFPADTVITVGTEGRIKWLAYFASALTGLGESDRERLFAEAAVVRAKCDEIRAFLYEPSHYTDPVRQPHVSPETVYEIDNAQVTQSHFIVLHARHPSLGAGQELEIAKNAGIPVVLLQARDSKVSRMVLGTTARLHEVHFSNADDLGGAVAPVLDRVVSDLLYRQSESTVGQTDAADVNATVGRRLRQLREAMHVDQATLARVVGLQAHGIEALETGVASNPSLTTLRRIATVLKTTVAYLTEGVATRPQDREPFLRDSYASLLHYAKDQSISVPDFEQLWNGVCDAHTTSRRTVAEARTSAISADEWSEKHAMLKAGKTKPKQLSLSADD